MIDLRLPTGPPPPQPRVFEPPSKTMKKHWNISDLISSIASPSLGLLRVESSTSTYY